jgi:site-specific DNA recombinase
MAKRSRRSARRRKVGAPTPALLKGLLYGPTGSAMSPTHIRRGNKLYRYYVSQSVLRHGPDACPVRRVPAAEIEAAVVDQLRGMLRSPKVIVATWRAARSEIEGLSEDAVRKALEQLDPLWDELFPAEQARIFQLLVARVDVGTDGLDMHLRTQGLTHTFQELTGVSAPRRAAA